VKAFRAPPAGIARKRLFPRSPFPVAMRRQFAQKGRICPPKSMRAITATRMRPTISGGILRLALLDGSVRAMGGGMFVRQAATVTRLARRTLRVLGFVGQDTTARQVQQPLSSSYAATPLSTAFAAA
jgi:hypothetical protein